MIPDYHFLALVFIIANYQLSIEVSCSLKYIFLSKAVVVKSNEIFPQLKIIDSFFFELTKPFSSQARVLSPSLLLLRSSLSTMAHNLPVNPNNRIPHKCSIISLMVRPQPRGSIINSPHLECGFMEQFDLIAICLEPCQLSIQITVSCKGDADCTLIKPQGSKRHTHPSR